MIAIAIEPTDVHRNGVTTAQVRARANGTIIHADKVTADSDGSRRKFAKAVAGKAYGPDAAPEDVAKTIADIDRQLLGLAVMDLPEEEPEEESEDAPAKPRRRQNRAAAVRDCLASTLSLKQDDPTDWSKRLFASACVCVRHDLSDQEAVQVIRDRDRLQHVDTDWTDDQISTAIRAAEKKTERGTDTGFILDPSNPLPSVRVFRDLEHYHPDGHTLLHTGDAFYLFTGRHYEQIKDPQIVAALYAWFDNAKRLKKVGETVVVAPFGPNRTSIGNAIDALKAESFTPAVAPQWLAGTGPDPREMIVTPNQIIHLQWDGPPEQIGKPTPRLFVHNSLDFDYNAAAPSPVRWLRFLNAIWKDCPESITALRQFIGYLLTADTRQQKALILVGPKRAGKGVITRIITRLIGAENVAGPTLSSLATNFGLWNLINKSVAIIGDARLSGKTDQAVIVERLLSITGNDTLDVDQKYQKPLSVRIPARVILVTNELPKFSDASGALASRFIILQLSESHFGKEDIELEDDIATEMPGILNWAINGWQDLARAGKFTIPASSIEAVQDMQDLASPVNAFMLDWTRRDDPDATISAQDLYDAWCCSCESEGQSPGTKQVFGRDLHAAAPWIEMSRIVTDDGTRQRVYTGLRLEMSVALTVKLWVENRAKKRTAGGNAQKS